MIVRSNLGVRALLILAAGCDSGSPVPQNAPAKPLQTLPAAADKSPSVDDLMKMGMPAPDRIWGPADYTSAVEVCRKLLASDVETLPRKESPRSGAVYSRMVA